MLLEIQPTPFIKNPKPRAGKEVFIADNARVIGDVLLGNKVSVWFNATIRGDVMPIVIGDETNIQDNTVIHATQNLSQTVIRERVTIGHSCLLHGCTVEACSLIGMSSVVMDNAVIPSQCIVGAGSLVTAHSHNFRPKTLILGRPAKEVRPLTEKEIEFLDESADHYLTYKTWYKK